MISFRRYLDGGAGLQASSDLNVRFLHPMSPQDTELSAEEYGSDEVADVVREDDDNELLISSQIWTRAEEGILKESIPIYRKTPFRKKGKFVEKKVVRRIKKLDITLHGAAAFEKGGEKYDDWKLKKAVCNR